MKEEDETCKTGVEDGLIVVIYLSKFPAWMSNRLRHTKL
jgi:hypothetical protein